MCQFMYSKCNSSSFLMFEDSLSPLGLQTPSHESAACASWSEGTLPVGMISICVKFIHRMIRFGSVVFEEIGNGGHKYVSHRPPPISELQSMQMEIKRISKTSPPPKKNNENHTSSVKSGTTIINYLEKNNNFHIEPRCNRPLGHRVFF